MSSKKGCCRVGTTLRARTPFNYMDGWFMGSFVYRAFRDLAREPRALVYKAEVPDVELVPR